MATKRHRIKFCRQLGGVTHTPACPCDQYRPTLIAVFLLHTVKPATCYLRPISPAGSSEFDVKEGLHWGRAVTRRCFPVSASPTRRFTPAGSNRSRHGNHTVFAAKKLKLNEKVIPFGIHP